MLLATPRGPTGERPLSSCPALRDLLIPTLTGWRAAFGPAHPVSEGTGTGGRAPQRRLCGGRVPARLLLCRFYWLCAKQRGQESGSVPPPSARASGVAQRVGRPRPLSGGRRGPTARTWRVHSLPRRHSLGFWLCRRGSPRARARSALLQSRGAPYAARLRGVLTATAPAAPARRSRVLCAPSAGADERGR
jgi:hypothetical protein